MALYPADMGSGGSVTDTLTPGGATGAGDLRAPRRLVAIGALAAVSCLAGGLAIEGLRFGWSDRAAAARVEREVRARLDDMVASLGRIATAAADRRDLIQPVAEDPEAARRLFEVLGQAVDRVPPGEAAVTVYGPSGAARAWTGRPAEIPRERIAGPDAYFVVPSPLGLRLFHVRPVFGGDGGGRLGAVAAERALSPPIDVAALTADHFQLHTALVPVAVRTRYEGAGEPTGPDRFLVRSPLGEPLLEVEVVPGRLARARAEWRRAVVGIALAVAALTLLLLIGPLLDRRLRIAEPWPYVRATAVAVGLVVAARAILWLAIPPGWSRGALFGADAYASSTFGPLLRSPVDFLATALTLAAIVALLAPGVGRFRLLARRRRPMTGRPGVWLQVAAGAGLAFLLAGHQLFLHDAVHNTSVDTLRFTLHPWDWPRLALMTGLVFFEAANLWACTLLLVVAAAVVRVRRGDLGAMARLWGAWLAPPTVAVVAAGLAGWPVPWSAVALAAVGVIVAARVAGRALAWYRHASQASRLLALFGTLLLPSLLLYPAVLYHTDRAKRQLIENDFAVQPAEHPQVLLNALGRSLDQIDAIPGLTDLVTAAGTVRAGAAPTETSFRLWSQTALAEQRLTSAIELYGPTGSLVSRFALNLPEYTSLAQTYRATGCGWEPTFGEAAPFGSEERRMLHAERGLCEPVVPGSRLMRVVGSIVVHVMLDYRTLPFLSAQGPYLELFRGAATPLDEATRGGDVELVIYGWGQLPIYTTGPGAWPLDEALFDRVYRSRTPFWARLPKDGRIYHVHLSNDRYGIYALGYPALTVADHLERLAELATLPGSLYVLLLVGSAVFARVARDRARLGRVLLREIRASFYRKLFLAFVAASVIPVLTMAFVARTYFANKLRADVEAEAARAASVAQRVIEEFAAIQQRGTETFAALNDDLMVLISQVINQDVNIFEGPDLVATSERDLFASGLLSQRTPNEVYRAIRLQRLPSFVGEDAIGSVRYMLAASPIRVAGHDAILTVPQALRQQEIEREIDDLDRGIHLASLIFVLLGAAIGLSMAERIADPVRRLTRATQRVARGDFDARILVRSADELQRLVDAFNAMAGELKTQAAERERTHRLEAWAEMARQVAHEIKNPLTPIQLSAEHLRRVHVDRGEPLSPVLERCVDSILNQVRLLRQISAEFSAFATTPAPRPEPVSAHDLIEEVLEPYRAGLSDRIALETAVAPGLPRLHVDRTLVGRALVNVIENALHATPGRGTLHMRAVREGPGIAITVSDTGAGMDPQALERIFEPYFSTRTTGTGLGLTIAKRNIESNGGTIQVVSARGTGTTVRVWLPAEDEA